MAISSSGIGSGLDVKSIISQLMAVESQPKKALDQKEANYQAKISGLGALKSVFSSLQTASSGMKTASTFTALKATVADTSIASASAVLTASQAKYTIDVVKLAQAQIISTKQNPTIATGALDITVASGTPVSVAVTATDTLPDIATNINANATLAPLVKASVVDGRLVIESKSTGVSNTISIDSTVLTDFKSTDPGASIARAAQDAELKINGLTVTRSSNTISDALTGITLTLKKTSAGVPTELTVGRDVSTMQAALEGFVKAYNDATKTIADLGKYDAATKQGSVLTGDAVLRTSQSQLRGLLSSTQPGLSNPFYQRLAQVGVTANTDGTLAVNGTKLSQAFASAPEDVAAVVAAFGKAFETQAKSLTGNSGLVSARLNGLNASIKDLDNRRDALNTRLATLEARYTKQFSALDSLVANSNKTSTFLTQWISSQANNS